MKSSYIPWKFLASLSFLGMWLQPLHAQDEQPMKDPDYPKEWTEIDSLESDGLLRSALEKVDALYRRAKADRKTAQVIKTVLYRTRFQSELEEDGYETAITSLRREMESAPFPVQPMLQSMLADLYKGYLQQHSWEIEERTNVAGDTGEDIRTWTAARFQEESARLFLASLADSRLPSVPIQDFGVILLPAKNTQGLWNSLYDLLVDRALDYFTDSRSFVSSPAYRFYIQQPEAFADAPAFSEFAFSTRDTASWEYQALTLFQDWLARKIQENQIPARIDADIRRLVFAREHSVHPQKDELFVLALQRLEAQFPQQTGIAEALFYRADQLFQSGLDYNPEKGEPHRLDKQKAKQLAEEAIRRFPGSYGASRCASLIAQITQPSLRVEMEHVLLPNKPSLLRASFQNVSSIHLRLLRLTEEELTKLKDLEREKAMSFLASFKPQKSWSASLPDDGDFQDHATEIKLDPLSLGQYVLLFSNEVLPSKKEIPNYSWITFAVSELAYFYNRSNSSNQLEFLVVHRDKGTPLEGVNAALFEESYDYQQRTTTKKEIGHSKTGPDGLVRFASRQNSFSLRLEKNGDVLGFSDRYYAYYGEEEETEHIETHFFLDRAIYRPGQTIYFKGIVTSGMPRRGGVKTLSNRKVRVTLKDVNDQEVAALDLTTNAFGSFQGNFTAPQGSLLGEMSMRSSLGESWKSFLVEEYKRPRFEVKLEPLEGRAKLNEEVIVKGKAVMFAGNPVDGAKVAYRVVRETRFPWWSWWRGIAPFSPSMEIAQGETLTDAQGVFAITFDALADPKADKDQLPEFQFRVYADVVDVTGETHSAERWVNVGYVSMRASLESPEWQDRSQPEAMRIRTENLDGQPIPVKGRVQIFTLDAPNRLFLKRYWDSPDRPSITEAAFRKDFPFFAYGKEDDPAQWAQKSQVWEGAFDTGQSDSLQIPVGNLSPGYYQVAVSMVDSEGKRLEIRELIKMFDSAEGKLPAGILMWNRFSKETAAPEENVELWMASSYAPGSLYLEKERDGRILESRWVSVNQWEKHAFRVEEEDRGNIFFHLSYVRHNRAFSVSPRLNVPWTNKQLAIEYQTFRDKLLPGQTEEWRIRLTGPEGERVAAELLAAMYDASLDQFNPNNWALDLYPSDGFASRSWSPQQFSEIGGVLYVPHKWPESMEKTYPKLNWFGLMASESPRMYAAMAFRSMDVEAADMPAMKRSVADSAGPPPPPPPLAEAENELFAAPQEPQVPPAPLVRSNLKETVFFFPQLYTDAQGAVVIKFTMNEALTRWKFLALAHTADLKTAISSREVTTSKDLMVLPNPPRFLREGDLFEFSAKVSNLSKGPLKGSAKLELFDALTMRPVDAEFENASNTLGFEAQTGQSAPLFWKIKVPEGKVGALTYRVSATAGDFTDAEENTLPVLINRMLVTETLPVYVRGGKTRLFTLESMKASASSKTLTPHGFTLEMTSNPAWLAVKALPYLMEYPYECSEQIFSRYYANTLASSVLDGAPRIKAMLEQWKNEGALESQLSKNQELKSLLLQETPWVLDSRQEEAQRKNIALLFDLNRMRMEQAKALAQLQEKQSASGGFPWFQGGPEDWFITQHIIAGLGKLDYLNIAQDPVRQELIENGLRFMDEKVRESYAELMKRAQEGLEKPEEDHLSSIIVHYLYARSFQGLEGLSGEAETAFTYFLEQAKKFWNKKGLMEQGMLAIALNRFAEQEVAEKIIASLRERALHSEELGMYWKTPRGMFWSEHPVEAQCLIMDAFHEVGENAAEVDEMKIWLLKHKQTNHWATTKATAEAVYSLLQTGSGNKWLSEDKPVQVAFPQIRKKKVVAARLAAAQKSAEPGTGYYKLRWEGKDIQTEMATVSLTNPNSSIAWGGLYWQYFEQLDQIKTFEETPLTLKKQWFKEVLTDKGPILQTVDAAHPLKPGDKLVVRLELRVDRQMEYVHLKDMRGSGLEPINPLSGYKWKSGLGFYESPGDVATNFFIDFLPRGTYVFEYPVRVNHRGDFSNGITTIQCMYAPEFSSHSAGGRVRVE
ncbi:MAG: alpha-2-macroglobulin [Haliscomenobacter sp.]|nr:alpha-2-macroglobulin [Haliscomenobacter sp.]